jgi:hypothetical protein
MINTSICPRCQREVINQLMGDAYCFMCQIEEGANTLNTRLVQHPEDALAQEKLCANCCELKPQSEFFLSEYCLDCESLEG